MKTDQLELRYIPLSQATKWDQNPKQHDIETLMRSIQQHGFGDPPKFDAQLEGLVYGNGRTEALERLQDEEHELPRGVLKLKSGEWALPVIFGVDAKSKAAAVAFAVDHNNLTLLGGGLDFSDVLAMWDEEGLQQVLSEAADIEDVVVSFDTTQLESLLSGPDFSPVGSTDQSSLDEKKKATCPNCGHVFRP